MSEFDKKIESINQYLLLITNLEESVRNYINTSRYQLNLVKNLDNWNQICSSLDTIGDTILTIEDYIATDYPKSIGLKYIYTYGILQGLFIQQDAMKHLSESFKIDYVRSEKLSKIRALRNAAIGHPTKNSVKTVTYYNYISRMSLHKWGFTLLRSSENNRTEFIDVDLLQILQEQTKEIEVSYRVLVEKLEEADKSHKEKYKLNRISEIFHPSVGYLFQKVAQGIHSHSPSERSFGLSMLDSIEEMYHKFETSLSERNELTDYIAHDLNEYKHGINVLKSFLSGESEQLSELDARIYWFYLSEQHKHFLQIANELDSEYLVNV